MRTLLVSIIVLFAFAGGVMAIDPPAQMKWGMSYDDVKQHLEKDLEKEKRLKVGKLKEDKKLAEGYTMAELKKVKLLKKDATEATAMFDPDGGLCGVYYTFRWTNSASGRPVAKCWEFQQSLSGAVTQKYGEPDLDETLEVRGELLTTNTSYQAKWVDEETGEEVIVVITRHFKDMLVGTLDDYYVILAYQTEKGKSAEKAQEETLEDI